MIIDSNTLVTIGVSEIGRIYFSKERGGFCFGSGITLALFHIAGTTPSRNELLNKHANGAASTLALSLSTNPGALSGPIALFDLILDKASSVVMTLIM